MTFFYSAIGILLFGSIFLINKYTLLFSNNNFIYIESKYIDSEMQQVDQFLLKLLNENRDLGDGKEICLNSKIEYEKSGLYLSNKLEYLVEEATNSRHFHLVNSCILTNGNHRILIKKDPDLSDNYLLNSCLLSKNNICDFEMEN